MDIFQILFTVSDVISLLEVFPSDLLPSSRPILKPLTLIVNADPHTEGVSNWLAIRLTPRSSSVYYFDSYGFIPLVLSSHAFLKRNYTTWDHNKRQLLGPTSYFYGQYCCLCALYMVRATLPNNSSRSSPAGAMKTNR